MSDHGRDVAARLQPRRHAVSGRLQAPGPAPQARLRPWSQHWHGRKLEDPWHWLRDPAYPEVRDPDVLAWLEAENAYYRATMAPIEPLVDALYKEIRGRQQEDDAAVPWRRRGWCYQWRFAAGAEYRSWWRWPEGRPEARHCLLDENVLARGHDYFRLGGLSASPDGRLLAYATDTSGGERYRLQVLDLEQQRLLAECIDDTQGAPVWSADGSCFLYVRVNQAWRPWQVCCHVLGTPVDTDRVVYEESDDSFFVGLAATQDDHYFLISSGDHVTSEVRVLPLDQPLGMPRLLATRQSGREYEVDHAHGRFWIRTNDLHHNFRLVSVAADAPPDSAWREEIAPSDEDYLLDHLCLADWLVIAERRQGLDCIRLRNWQGEEHWIEFPEPAYSVGLGTNPEFDVNQLRLVYSSMVTPDTVFDYDLVERALIERRVRQVPSGYDPTTLVTERLWITARDGVRVPVSLLRRRDRQPDDELLYLTAYGAYGMAYPPAFSPSRLSLLDRGYAVAIAHIRGGDDLGYQWYQAGKLEQRWNTFNDFIDVARGLIEQGLTRPGSIAISGGSAGGELMGVVCNEAPELWGAVVAHVPFVDVLQTMLDDSLPLTPIEWPEWGNPRESAEMFDLIRSYSPCDNVRAQAYPPMLVTAGISDPRVTYWEPARWVARLRALRTDDQVLLLRTNMQAGHGGASGRWEAIRELAEEYAFILATCGDSGGD